MEIRLPYGRGDVGLRLPPDIDVEFLKPRDSVPLEDIEASFLAAMNKPISSPSLDNVLSADSSVAILISDITRAKGAEKLLPLVVRYLDDIGVSRSSMKILVARGTHRKLTKEEKNVLKSKALSGVVVEEHDCDDTSKLSALLLTSRGTPVRTNTILREADISILLSPISFHYFAGFGGGRKLVLPGSTDRASIVANHRLSLVDGDPVRLHDGCRAGNLAGNPVHEDMCETLAALDSVFGINFFANTADEMVFMNAGDPLRAHVEACEEYEQLFSCPVESLHKVVVSSAGGFPYDINMLQSHKGLRHASGALSDGGTVLYYAECEEGLGSAALEGALSMDRKKFLKTARQDYALNNTTAVSLHDLTDHFEIGMVSAMNVDLLLSCGIKSCVNTEAYLAEALEKHETNRVAVITHGAATLPRMKGHR